VLEISEDGALQTAMADHILGNKQLAKTLSAVHLKKLLPFLVGHLPDEVACSGNCVFVGLRVFVEKYVFCNLWTAFRLLHY
jgi:hypothetical protein